MKVSTSIRVIAVAPLLWAQIAQAEDLALVLGEVGQLATLRNDTAVISADFAGPLRDAGFDIVQPKNRSSGNMRLAAQRIEAAAAGDRLGRLVILVTGPLASSERESWALSNGATGVTSLNVGLSGLSLGTLSDLATAARGPAVIMVAPGKEVSSLGIGLRPGLHDLQIAEDVTYVIGPAEALLEVLLGGLLDPGLSFAEVARRAPSDVQVLGFLSEETGLMNPINGSD